MKVKVCCLSMAVLVTVLGMQVAICGDLNWSGHLPDRIKLGQTVTLTWKDSEGAGATNCRYKLDAPGDWLGGIQYAINKWSEWGNHSQVLYSHFVNEGAYTFTVEWKDTKGGKRTISHRFKAFFEYPEKVNDLITIDWNHVNAGVSKPERLARLSSEYKKAHQYWMERFEYERAKLKCAVTPRDLIDVGSGAIVDKGQDMLLTWADKGVAGAASKILAPKLLYDIGKQLGVDMFLIYQNMKANAAAQNAIFTYHAYRFYEKMSKS